MSSYGGDTGAFFTANRRAQLGIRHLLGSAHEESPDVIYHYTDSNALLGILEAQEFWMTDYSYLSDYREVAHGVSLAQTLLSEWETSDEDGFSEEMLAKVRQDLEDLRHTRVGICSFSEEPDSLPQWRAYGGVAVGLEPGPAMLGYAPDSILDRVIYDQYLQREALRHTIHEHVAAVAIDEESPVNLEPESAGQTLAARLLQRIAFFKDPAYKEEREVRYCYVEDRRAKAALGVDLVRKRHRTIGDVIVPFVGSRDIIHDAGSSPFSGHRIPIIEVVIGPHPHSDLLAQGVRDALDSHGYPDAAVHLSKVPFRSF
jgi:hypothetical protein